jgi:hypothetical protein
VRQLLVSLAENQRMTTIRGPVVLFKNGELFPVAHRQREAGGKVEFQFKDRAQYDKFMDLFQHHAYPMLVSTPFLHLARAMFGKDATRRVQLDGVMRTRANLSLAEMRALTDPKAIEKVIREKKVTPLIGSPSAMAAEVAKVARFVVGMKDKNGVSVFHLLDLSARGGGTEPKANGRIFSEDVGDLEVNISRRAT